MSRNGSGVYNLPTNSWNPAIVGVSATPADWQALINDVAAALTQSLSADGQTPLSGNLNMAGNKLTGLAAGTSAGQSLRFEQLFSQGLQQDVAAAATTDIGAQLSTLINVTGSATITSFGTNYNGPRFLRFAGVCTLTNSATLVLPGGANITTAAGDSAIAVPLGNPATGWRVAVYERADGTILSNAYALLSGATFTGNVNVPSLNGGQLAGMRNKIINGKMEIAQRGTNFPAIGNAYSLDRWSRFSSASEVLTLSRQQDVPSSNEFQYSLRAAITTADASIAAGDTSSIFQLVEGFNARDLIGRTFTLSFWVRSSKTGIHCVAFGNSGVDRSYVAEYTVNAANTWEQKSVTLPGGLITAGTWNWLEGIGLRVVFVLAAGSTFQTTAGAWQTGNFLATANQVNCLDTVGNIFAITGVQLEVGEVATPFEHRPYGQELVLCQRYYQTTVAAYAGQATSGIGFGAAVSFPVQMRATPSFALLQSLTNIAFPATIGTFNVPARVGAYLYEKTATATGGSRYADLLSASAEL